MSNYNHNSNYNQIRLIKGYGIYTPHEYRKFKKYDTLREDPIEELDRWLIEDEDKALEALSQLRNTYHRATALYYITEYALEYYRADEDGDFVEGSDYEYAEDNEVKKEESEYDE